MKPVRLSWALACLTLTLSACSHRQDDLPPIGLDSNPQKYFLNSIIIPDEVKVEKVDRTSSWVRWDSSDSPLTAATLAISIAGKHVEDQTHGGKDYVDFCRLADSIGDGRYYAPKSHSTDGGVYKHTITSGVSSISLTAQTDYSPTHPAGSDLSGITWVHRVDIVKKSNGNTQPSYLENVWKKYGRQVQPPFDSFSREVVYSSLDQIRDIPIPAVLTSFGAGSTRPRYGGSLYFLKFSQEPSTPQQKMHLELTLMNGTKLTKDFTIDFAQ